MRISNLIKNGRLSKIRQLYKKKSIEFILQEAKMVKEGKKEREVICVKGDEKDIEKVITSLRISAGVHGIILSLPDNHVFGGELNRKVYVYKTSQIDPGDDYWIGKYHPGFVLIIEDNREFLGQHDEKIVFPKDEYTNEKQ